MQAIPTPNQTLTILGVEINTSGFSDPAGFKGLSDQVIGRAAFFNAVNIGTVVKAIIIVIGILLVLEIWGVPTSPILLVVALVVLIAALASRETLPNILAGFQSIQQNR